MEFGQTNAGGGARNGKKRKTVHNPSYRIMDGGIFAYNLLYYRLIILCQLIPQFVLYSKIQIPNKKIHPFAF